MKATVSEAKFIQLWDQHKSVVKLAEAIGVTPRSVNARRRSIERKNQMVLPADSPKGDRYYPHAATRQHPARHQMHMVNGSIVVFSDAHFWPGVRTTAYRGLLNVIRNLKPAAVINNGDAFDGASISRHPRIGWDSKPTVQDEVRACVDRLGEIQEAAGSAKLLWPMGNHDARFETFLAANVPQFQGVQGFTLRDKFPDWIPCWSIFINDDVVIKHRYKSGIHATHNNTMWAGRTMVTGHLHSLKVTPLDDYNGTRWGVDTGTLAEPNGPQFEDYLETNPTNWRSGFVVLTWRDGRLMWPEIARVWDANTVEFRGNLIDVSQE